MNMKRSLVFLLLLVFSLSIFAQKDKNVSKSPKEKSKAEEFGLSDLPQTPRVIKEATDAQDQGLKGKVRKVVEDTKSFSGPWSKHGRKLSGIIYFDENGFYLRKENYSLGKNDSTYLYGYIDSKRVSKTIYPTKNLDKTFRVATNIDSSEQ